jgi:hypothetical protein
MVILKKILNLFIYLFFLTAVIFGAGIVTTDLQKPLEVIVAWGIAGVIIAILTIIFLRDLNKR